MSRKTSTSSCLPLVQTSRSSCPDIASALDCVNAINNQQQQQQQQKISIDPDQLNDAVSKLSNHAIGYCKCISQSTAYLAAASCKFQLFLQTSELNVAEVIQEEKSNCRSLSEAAEDKTDSDQFVGNAPKNPSRFDCSVLPHLVNRVRQTQLLEPLDGMLTFFESANKSNDGKVSKDQIRRFRVQDNLRASFYIYQLYRLVNNQHRCASLIKDFSCSHSDTLRSLYFNLSIALLVGDIEMAVYFRSEAEKYDVVKSNETSLNIDSTIFFYLSIEIDLRKGVDRGECLQTFLNSPVIQKVTVNRYFLKALGLLLASKFPGNFSYRHDKYFKEMIDPHCMALYMVKRWNKKLADLESGAKMNPDELLDPMWLRYATYNLFFDSFVTTSAFYCKTGNPSELTYFHEAAIRLSREYCLLYWLRKVLIMASEVDVLMDKLEYAHCKLTNALELIDHESEKLNVPIGRNVQCIKKQYVDDGEDTLKLSTVKLEMYDEGDCLHSQKVSNWDVKKTTMKQSPDNTCDFLHCRDYLTLEPVPCGLYGADVDRIEAIMKLIMLKYKTHYERVAQLNKVTFSSNLNNSYKATIAIRMLNQRRMKEDRVKLYRQEVATFLSLKLRTIRSTLVIECGLSSMANLNKQIEASRTVFLKEYNQRIDLIDGYSSRMVFAQFCLLHAMAASKSTSCAKAVSILPLYEKYSSIKQVSNKERTPSPPRSMRSRKQPPPRAPKGKNPYKMEEFQEYFKNLNQPILQEKARNCGNFSLAQRYKKILEDISLRDASFECEKAEDKKQSKSRSISKSVSSQVPVSGTETNKSLRDAADTSHCQTKVDLFRNFSVLNSDSSVILFALEHLLKYTGNHPPSQFYRQINQQMVHLFLDVTIQNLKLASYHFAELASSSLRYRFMKMATRRLKAGKSIAHPPEDLQFGSQAESDYVQKVLGQCPTGWRIIQLEITEPKIEGRTGKIMSLPDLLIARFEKGRNGLFLTIKSDENKYLRDFMTEMREIVELSNASTRERDPSSFWKVRTALDSRLDNLLKSVENAWLGPFKGVFLGIVDDKQFSELTRKVRLAIMKICDELPQKVEIDQELLRVLVESISVLSEDDFKVGVASLLNSFDASLLDQVWDLTMSTLKEYSNVYATHSASPVGLILGKGLEMFPWESIPVARGTKQEIFRIPSLRFLSASLTAFSNDRKFLNGLDSQSTFYLINPTANLPNTEGKFRSKMKKQEGWTGVIGRVPKVEEFVEGLETKDIYVYFGHGAGTDYCKMVKENLEGVDVKTASLVIGCSSGRLRSDGTLLEPHGPAYKFLSNGSPTYVGVLWDVTDRDIDLFSDSMLAHLIQSWQADQSDSRKTKKPTKCQPSNEPASICKAVSEARDACKLKYLIGAATVVYGLPVKVSPSR